MIDHITYCVPVGTLAMPILTDFFTILGFVETDPSMDVLEEGYRVRWFAANASSHPNPDKPVTWYPTIHLVEPTGDRVLGDESDEEDYLGLGHFCVQNVPDYEVVCASHYVVRDTKRKPGDPRRRCWLRFANLRVEVRP